MSFVVVGGISAVLHGAPITTYDLDVVHARTPENIQKLLKALSELDAFYREHPQRRLRPNESYLSSAGHQLLTTQYGDLDLRGTIGQSLGYEELLPETTEMEFEGGMKISVLNLSKLIAIKEQLGTEKDKAALPMLRRTLEEQKKR